MTKRRDYNVITWYINDICNFQCEYCFVWKNMEKISLLNLDKIKDSLDMLAPNWVFNISGGEPFMDKNFVEICQSITKKHIIGGLYTNLSLPNVFDFADQIKADKVGYIDASIHIIEREKRDPKLSHFIEKIIYLQNKGFKILATYVPHPSLMNRVEKDVELLKSNGVENVRMKNFVGIYQDKYYPTAFTQDERKLLQSIGMDEIEFDVQSLSHNYFSKLCYAGVDFFVMDRFGNLKRCVSSNKTYGNLFEKNISFDKNPRPCPVKDYICIQDCLLNSIDKKANFFLCQKEVLMEKIRQKLNQKNA